MQDVFSKEKAFSKAESEAVLMAGVYRWMTIGLGITGATAYLASRNNTIMGLFIGTPLIWVLMIAEFGLVFYLSAKVYKMTVEKARSIFFTYSALNGLTLSILFLMYTSGSIASTFFVTAGTFGAMSIYGYTTKKDLTSWGSFFYMGLIGIILASIVNLFMHSSALYFAINCIGVFVFTGLTAYDTQNIKNSFSYGGFQSDSMAAKLQVMGALTLYLDFINLFIFMLRLLGGRDD